MLHRYFRRRKRSLIRNSRKILHSGDTNLLLEARKSLFRDPLNTTFSGGFFDLFRCLDFNRELLVRQFLVKKRHYHDLEKNILIDPLNVTFAMPPEWVQTLEKNGFRVNKLHSVILWKLCVFVMGCYGIVLALREIRYSFQSETVNRYQPHAFFVNLPNSAVPKINILSRRTILNWYDKRRGNELSPKKVLHNVNVHTPEKLKNISFEGVRHILPSLNFAQSLLLFFWTLLIFARGFTESLLGNWWTLFCMSELVLAKKTLMLPVQKLARIYLFSHEYCVYKPLWILVAEQKGCKGVVYFYSTNSVGPKTKTGQRDYFFAFDYMNWQHYLTWSEEHKKQLLELTKGNQNTSRSNFLTMGSIDFFDGKTSLSNLEPATISVFDVAPYRISRRALFNTSHDLYSYENISKFLLDIDECRKKLGFKVAFKSKRSASLLHDPRYFRLIERLKLAGWLIIEPSTAPTRLLEGSIASIHYPFTSTAILAKEIQKKSVYYDPTGQLACSELANIGCNVINAKAKLMLFCRSSILSI